MAILIPLSDLAQAIDRPESLIRIAAKSRDITIEAGAVSLSDVALIVRIFAGSYTDETAEMHQLLTKSEEQSVRAAGLAQALEQAKRDNAHQVQTINELRTSLHRAEARADRMETMLYDFSKSLAHLVDQRDRIVASHLGRSRAIEFRQGGKKVLLLCDPVA